MDNWSRYNFYKTGIRAPIITIYENPSDYPGQYVARVWDIDRPTELVFAAPLLTTVLNAIPGDFVAIPREPEDDPVIVTNYV